MAKNKKNRVVVYGKDFIEQQQLRNQGRIASATDRQADGVDGLREQMRQSNERAENAEKSAKRAGVRSWVSVVIAGLSVLVNILMLFKP